MSRSPELVPERVPIPLSRAPPAPPGIAPRPCTRASRSGGAPRAVVGDGGEDVRLAQPRGRIDEQGVVAGPRRFRGPAGGGAGEPVGRAHHEGIERQFRIEIRHERRGCWDCRSSEGRGQRRRISIGQTAWKKRPGSAGSRISGPTRPPQPGPEGGAPGSACAPRSAGGRRPSSAAWRNWRGVRRASSRAHLRSGPPMPRSQPEPYTSSPTRGWPDMGEVHPDLVGAPGLKRDLQEVGPHPALTNARPGHRPPSALDHGHALTVPGIPPDGGVHRQR